MLLFFQLSSEFFELKVQLTTGNFASNLLLKKYCADKQGPAHCCKTTAQSVIEIPTDYIHICISVGEYLANILCN